MKHSLLFMLYLMFFNYTNIIAVQNNQKNSSFYNCYFTIKEFSKFCITYRYYFDQEKIEKAKIACNQCDYIAGYRHLCCHCIFEIEETKLKNIVNQMNNLSCDELNSFLLDSYKELKVKCSECNQYHDWHIDLSPQNLQAARENQQLEITKKKLYASYFIIKEFFKMTLYEHFINNKKIKDSSICCNKCNHESDAQWLWMSLIFKCDENSINQLKDFIYNKTAEELAIFILQKHQESELYCAYCGDYNNYYIPEKESLQDN